MIYNYDTDNERLLVIIPGSKPAKPGIWADISAIQNSLNIGSMIPYIKRAVNEGYSIIILNPNKNRASDNVHRTNVSHQSNTMSICPHTVFMFGIN